MSVTRNATMATDVLTGTGTALVLVDSDSTHYISRGKRSCEPATYSTPQLPLLNIDRERERNAAIDNKTKER